jgi:hypothetical protein
VCGYQNGFTPPGIDILVVKGASSLPLLAVLSVLQGLGYLGVSWPRTRFKCFEKASYRFLPDFIANVAGAADGLQTSQPTAGKTNNNHAQKQE